jgi:hypothetical protein
MALTLSQKQQCFGLVYNDPTVPLLGNAEYLRAFNASGGTTATDPVVLAATIKTAVLAYRTANVGSEAPTSFSGSGTIFNYSAADAENLAKLG